MAKRKDGPKVFRVGKIAVDKMILRKRFAPCDLAACRHACCRYGAVIGTGRAKKIAKALPELMPLMRPEAVEAVKKKGFHLDKEFTRFDMHKGHKHYYMRTVKGRCIFLNFNDNGGCVLQKYAKSRGMKYQLKPEGCWGFPFDLVGNRLIVYKWDNLPCLDDAKNKKAPFIYRSCKNEIVGLLGKRWYADLLKTIPAAGD